MNGGVRTKPCAFSGCFIPAWGSPRTGLQGSNVSLWREARGFARGKTDRIRWHETDSPWQGYRPQCRVFTEKPCSHNPFLYLPVIISIFLLKLVSPENLFDTMLLTQYYMT